MNAHVLLYIFQSLYRESIGGAVRLALALGTGVDVICTLTKQCAIISLSAGWAAKCRRSVEYSKEALVDGRATVCKEPSI